MYEEELLEKLRKSSEAVKIPEELMPEEIEKKLGSTKKKPQKWMGVIGASAAALLLMCSIGAVYRANYIGTKNMESDRASAGMEEAEVEVMEEAPEETVAVAKSETPKKDAGNLYQVAKDYTQVYQALQPPVYPEEVEVVEEKRGFLEKVTDLFDSKGADYDGSAASGAMEESAVDDVNDAAMDTGGINESVAVAVNEDSSDSAASKGSSNYSKTNLQTQGVDESDIVKTDGSYIYTVSGSEVDITDIREKEMKLMGTITIGDSSADVRVVEMYVDGDQIYLIVEKEETTLEQGEIKMREADPKYGAGKEKDSYQVAYKEVTELLTYDISDRKNPKLKGTVTQDGYYKTSRKIGSLVYLFTEGYMEQTRVENEQLISDQEARGFIPLVNGNMVSADCIYLPEYGEMGCVISSVDTKKPDQIVDNVLILNNHAQIYVSQNGIYLYHTDYQNEVKTRIAKFTMKKGEINAAGAAAVTGEVYDTFAVAEEKGNLRILTTSWSSGEDRNNLYLLDENLKLTGKLEGMAKGEQIYSARFLGDVAYFVTYRNTDPLFAVDLSDPKNPKILSEVKLSGFSEYLHFWGEDKLVGIGFETDEDSGIQEGLKLVLFDIKDPANVKIVKEFVIENGDYSPALYQYKTVLADPEENLLGFAMSSYQNGEKKSYLLFTVENGEFINLLTTPMDDTASIEEFRGMYAGDRFYLASPENITSFDRKQNYRKIQKLEL
ncbi:MAG: beta-propeller domain-containing protein [Roseburia sp.]|nr:beta-propeller domain-containing protein [Roseburia sp.]